MNRLILASEQHKGDLLIIKDDLKEHFLLPEYDRYFCSREINKCCFKIYHQDGNFSIDSSYFIGVDWIIEDKVSLYIEPKLNNECVQIDFLSMLMESLEAPENFNHLDNLFNVDYDKSWIAVPQKKDLLTPILIVQFLKLVHHIVKKGLKKSYYTVQANLTNKVKGKILIGRQIKENLSKNKLTSTVCEYQEFGFNFQENQFLKTVLQFVKTYIYRSSTYFSTKQKEELTNILSYCEPAFHNVDELSNKHLDIKISRNVFYKDYNEAIRIGRFILQQFSFNLSKVNGDISHTPPFWIDMSKLFELYVFKKLSQIFPGHDSVSYHDRFMGGKETDILLKSSGYQAVVDCKYKPQYHRHNPSLEDKRQLAGYTRLKSVYDRLRKPYNEVIRGLIVFSHQDFPEVITQDDLFKSKIAEYIEFYKLGLGLPVIKQ